MKSTGSQIKFCRERLDLTQEELAKKLGYKSRSSINKIELGETDITMSKVEEFAKVLDVSPSYLVGWDDADDVQEDNILVAAYIPDGYDSLSDEDREEIDEIIKMKLARQRKQKINRFWHLIIVTYKGSVSLMLLMISKKKML